MSQRRPNSFRGPLLLLLAGGGCLLALPASARAAGCHVPERPVLGHALSWDLWASPERPHASTPAAPQSMRRLPCEGETPSENPSVTSVSPPASLERRPAAPDPRGEFLAAVPPRSLPRPVPPRLDRPPR